MKNKSIPYTVIVIGVCKRTYCTFGALNFAPFNYFARVVSRNKKLLGIDSNDGKEDFYFEDIRTYKTDDIIQINVLYCI